MTIIARTNVQGKLAALFLDTSENDTFLSAIECCGQIDSVSTILHKTGARDVKRYHSSLRESFRNLGIKGSCRFIAVRARPEFLEVSYIGDIRCYICSGSRLIGYTKEHTIGNASDNELSTLYPNEDLAKLRAIHHNVLIRDLDPFTECEADYRFMEIKSPYSIIIASNGYHYGTDPYTNFEKLKDSNEKAHVNEENAVYAHIELSCCPVRVSGSC